jgi:hypothetical protein
MGLIGRIFRGDKERAPGTTTTFRESEPDGGDEAESRNAPRRELVQMVLRDTMRKHGIPSDWIECRVLSTVNRVGRHGMHVNFVVKQAHERLLGYVFAFQDSFERELSRFEPRARDWLLSLGWEFQNFNATEMPDPRTWSQSGSAPLQGANGRALPTDFPPLQVPVEAEPPKSDEDVQRDLRALFAIRDAAMSDTKRPRAPSEQNDFEPTQPFHNTDGEEKK